MQAQRSVLICTLPRSGSWLVAEALENTQLCGRPREYFRPAYQRPYMEAWNIPLQSSYDHYFAAVLEAGTTPNGTFSTKLHWGQFPHLLACLTASVRHTVPIFPRHDLVSMFFPSPTYIYLTRKDKARQAISLYRAIQSDVWWKLETRGQDKEFLTRRPDFAEIRRLETELIEYESCWDRYFEEGAIKPISVTYEELCANYQAAAFGLLDLLGISVPGGPDKVPLPTLLRQADQTSERWLRDYRA
jgi:LPS sulfotransferase NodH